MTRTPGSVVFWCWCSSKTICGWLRQGSRGKSTSPAIPPSTTSTSTQGRRGRGRSLLNSSRQGGSRSGACCRVRSLARGEAVRGSRVVAPAVAQARRCDSTRTRSTVPAGMCACGHVCVLWGWVCGDGCAVACCVASQPRGSTCSAGTLLRPPSGASSAENRCAYCRNEVLCFVVS